MRSMGVRYGQRGRDWVMLKLKLNKKFLPQDLAGTNQREFICIAPHDAFANSWRATSQRLCLLGSSTRLP